MSADKERITKPEMVEAIRKSGYLIEQRVAGLLAKHGYYVETNPAENARLFGESCDPRNSSTYPTFLATATGLD